MMSNFLVFAADINITPPPNVRILDIGKLISSLIGLILIIAGLAAFAYLLWGGINWITSGGDKSQVEAAQHRIQAAIVGLFIVFAAWALMLLIQSFLGVKIIGESFRLPSPIAKCTDLGGSCVHIDAATFPMQLCSDIGKQPINGICDNPQQKCCSR